MGPDPIDNAVTFADVDPRFGGLVGIISDEEINSCAGSLIANQGISQARPRRYKCVTGPVHDLGCKDARGRPVDEIKAHASTQNH
jgi:hypothetical protein